MIMHHFVDAQLLFSLQGSQKLKTNGSIQPNGTLDSERREWGDTGRTRLARDGMVSLTCHQWGCSVGLRPKAERKRQQIYIYCINIYPTLCESLWALLIEKSGLTLRDVRIGSAICFDKSCSEKWNIYLNRIYRMLWKVKQIYSEEDNIGDTSLITSSDGSAER